MDDKTNAAAALSQHFAGLEDSRIDRIRYSCFWHRGLLSVALPQAYRCPLRLLQRNRYTSSPRVASRRFLSPLTGYLGVCPARTHTITEDKPLAAIVRVKLIHWIGLKRVNSRLGLFDNVQ